MRFQCPFVSRRAYELMERVYEQTIRERDEQQSRADRLADQLVDRFGFQPVSAPVRAELKAATEEFERTHAMEQYEDPGYGQIAEELFVENEKPV